MAPNDGSKRKEPPAQNGPSQARVKRAKIWEAREIRAEPSHKALNERKELDVGSFVKSHEFEIRALEQGIISSKSALSQRAFQQVPRQLRRRTASHNVKKVPKRLRTRAAREMKEDKTPPAASRGNKITGKQRLRDAIASTKRKVDNVTLAPSRSPSKVTGTVEGSTEDRTAPILVRKHKKRQSNKSWLPTHMFHAKRAHMTPPMKPLWKFAIPITPTEKSYRQTHRAFTLRGCVAWDMSYMSTVQLFGSERSILRALDKLSVPGSNMPSESLFKWMEGKQTWTGFLHETDEDNQPLAPVTIIWSPAEKHATLRRVLVRVHPSAFHELWVHLKSVSSMQRPAVEVRDMRFELGSIEVTGPAAMEAIVRIVQPSEPRPVTFEVWTSLAAVTNPASLPRNPVLGFSMEDTRLNRASHTFHQTQPSRPNDELLQLLSNWPPESERKPYTLLVDQDRKISQQQKLSQKTIDKWKSEVSSGERIKEVPPHHAIPAILYALQRDYSEGGGGSWILMLPWEHVLPTWHSLMHVNLVGGGQPRMGGLREQRQKAFEGGTPWFPGDFPSSAAGWAWELYEREQRLREWQKKPKSKRVEFHTLDLGYEMKGELGRGWACDWEYLCGLKLDDSGMYSVAKQKKAHESTASNIGLNEPSGSPNTTLHRPSPIKPNTLAVVSITFCGRGHVSVCARVYRLPAALGQRKAWLRNARTRLDRDLGHPQDKRTLQTKSLPDEDVDGVPETPPAKDLVGFITSGNYNLGEGQATAIGSVHFQKLLDAGETKTRSGAICGWCIVREVGETVPRLAKWEQRTFSRAMP